MLRDEISDDKLHDFARIEEEAEKRIIRRAEQGARIIKLCWTIVVVIVLGVAGAATAWTLLKVQVNNNTRAIRIIWQKQFGTPLP